MADALHVAQTATNIDCTTLPASVLAGFVRYLNHADQAKLLVVCKAWSLPVASAMYRAPLLQSSDSFERLIQLLNTPLPAHPYPELIRELDIGASAADNLYMGDLDNALAVCTGLEVFRLENCFHISNILVRSLAAHCTNLKQVDLPGCPISDSFIPVLSKNCRQIERLDLSFTNLTVASLHAIVINCDSLLQLDLSECRPLEDDVSLDLSTKNFSRPLKWLSLRNTSVSDDLLRFAATHCPNLEDLVLESCDEITDDAIIKVASTCAKLRRLDMSFCDNITDLSLQALAMRAATARGGVLRELYLTACDNISPAAVQYVAQQCLQLNLLVLDGCDKLLGTYVQSFSHQPCDDELECLLEGEAIRRFAQHVPGTNPVTPPASPGRLATGADSHGSYKVQVSYATSSYTPGGDSAGNGWRSSMSSVYGQDPAAIAAAALEAAKMQDHRQPPHQQLQRQQSTDKTLSRRPSRTMMLRKRSSMVSITDAAAEAEAAKQERQEKIREKRRSRVYSAAASNELAEQAAAMMLATPAPSSVDSTPIASPFAAREAPIASTNPAVAATPAAGVIPLASGRRRSQIVTQGSAASLREAGGWDSPVSASTSPAPSSQTGEPFASRPASPGVAEKTLRRRSGQIAPGSFTGAQVNSGALPAASAPGGSDGEQPVLLASGRAARAAARNAATVPAAPRCDSPTSVVDESAAAGGAPVLLASGRRRSRTNSVASIASLAPTPSQSAPPATPPAAPAAPWGANPQAWNNPAQLTSASSQWSNPGSVVPTAVNQAPSLQQQAGADGGFVDPWAKTPSHRNSMGPGPMSAASPVPHAPATADPWAARPASSASNGSYAQPATSSQQYFSPPQPQQQRYAHHHTVAPLTAPLLHSRPSSPNIRLAAPTGWGTRATPPPPPASGTASMWAEPRINGAQQQPPHMQQQQQQQHAGYFERTRNRMSSAGGMSASPYEDADYQSVHHHQHQYQQQQPNGASNGASFYGRSSSSSSQNQAAAEPDYPTASSGGFAYSQTRRGKMLLKLKIETRSGGHQTLAVHENDDPAQLATEFTSFWDMAGFREPLVRLISVRKSNAIRQRSGFH
ncbi:hypothetical protein HDU86_000065 [Geranomyces michiganensis]|nr:hypothetical protein HDU86_000065 [Geranomyces michiganensis]